MDTTLIEFQEKPPEMPEKPPETVPNQELTPEEAAGLACMRLSRLYAAISRGEVAVVRVLREGKIVDKRPKRIMLSEAIRLRNSLPRRGRNAPARTASGK